jgi:photoactive yellow protein
MGFVGFGKSDIDNVLSKMSATDIDKLAFGAVELDRTGKIIRYNAAEGEITGRDPRAVIGRNFFTDVAPCTNTPRLQGCVRQGVAAGKPQHDDRVHLRPQHEADEGEGAHEKGPRRRQLLGLRQASVTAERSRRGRGRARHAERPQLAAASISEILMHAHDLSFPPPWWQGSGTLERVVTDLIATEFRTLRPGTVLPLLPWSADLTLCEGGLGLDSLDLLTVAGALSELLQMHESGLEDYLIARRTLGEWLQVAQASLSRHDAALTFRTSGTTGEPKRCVHALAELEAEAAFWGELLAGRRRVLTAVPATTSTA